MIDPIQSNMSGNPGSKKDLHDDNQERKEDDDDVEDDVLDASEIFNVYDASRHSLGTRTLTQIQNLIHHPRHQQQHQQLSSSSTLTSPTSTTPAAIIQFISDQHVGKKGQEEVVFHYGKYCFHLSLVATAATMAASYNKLRPWRIFGGGGGSASKKTRITAQERIAQVLNMDMNHMKILSKGKVLHPPPSSTTSETTTPQQVSQTLVQLSAAAAAATQQQSAKKKTTLLVMGTVRGQTDLTEQGGNGGVMSSSTSTMSWSKTFLLTAIVLLPLGLSALWQRWTTR